MHRGNMYVFGGWNGLHALDDVVAFSISDQSWHAVTCIGEPPNERNNHAVALVGDQMYVHGGHDGVVWLDDLSCLNLETLRWDKTKLSTSSTVTAHLKRFLRDGPVTL